MKPNFFLVERTCGMTTNQNCTYFVNPEELDKKDVIKTCDLEVCPFHDNICQVLYRV